MPFLNICFVHDTCKPMTLRVGHNVPFAALDLLPGVDAAWSDRFCRLDALTINDCCRRFFVTTAMPARDANERFVEKIEDAAIKKSREIIPEGHEECQTLREQRP